MSDDNFIGYYERKCEACGDIILVDPQEVGADICGECKKIILELRNKRRRSK